MRQYLVATSLAVGVSLGLACAPLCAKPADLPAAGKILCVDGQEQGEHGGIAIDLDALAAPGAIDVVNPVLLGAWLEQWFDVVAKLLPAADAREQQAQQAFDAAERTLRSGDFATARTGYQQVHMLAPTSRMGRLAIDRIIEIERVSGRFGEESEPPMRNR